MGWRPSVPAVWVVYALAAAVLAQATAYVWYDTHPPVAAFADATILGIFALAIGAIGYRLQRDGVSRDAVLRVAIFSLGGGLIVGVLALLFVVIRLATNDPFPDMELVLFIGWSVGSAAGAWSGYYYVGLESSLDEQRELTKRLTVLQRVLRHNLRNEMSIVGGVTRDLAATAEDPETRADLAVIDRHVERVIELSERSQMLTRIWQTETRTTAELATLAAEEAERFREAHPSVPLTVDLQADLWIQAHTRFRLAIREALANAVEHNENVELTVSTKEGTRKHAVVVTDTGQGVPDSELEPLWAPTEGPLDHTTGLGLWMIYWLVESSGGALEVETGPGGTTVEMWLPVA